MPACSTAHIQQGVTGFQSEFIDNEFNLELTVFSKNIIEVIGRMTIEKSFPVTFFHKATCFR